MLSWPPHHLNSSGESVEGSNFLPSTDEEAFKKFLGRGGIDEKTFKSENELEIKEYRIEENSDLPPTHASKEIGVTLYRFQNRNGSEAVEVGKLFENIDHPLKVMFLDF